MGSLFLRTGLGSFAWYVVGNYYGVVGGLLAIAIIAGVSIYFMGRKEAAVPVVVSVLTMLILISVGMPDFWAMAAAGFIVVPVVFGLVLPKVSPRMPALT